MLIGQQLCLAPVLQTDAAPFFGWMNELALMHSNGAYRPMDQLRFDQWFNGIANDASRVVFAIRRQGDLRLMGYVQLVNIQPAARTAELGIIIGDARDRGQGFGQEAVSLALQFAWRELNLQRVGLFVIGDNPMAVHAYLKAGFALEGLMRRAAYVDGAYQPITVMGALRPDEALEAPPPAAITAMPAA